MKSTVNHFTLLQRNERLGIDLKQWVYNYHKSSECKIYYNDVSYTWDTVDKYWLQKNEKATQYVPFADDQTVTMTFEGKLYWDLHEYTSTNKTINSLTNLFYKHGFKYVLCHSWALTAVDIH